MLRENGANLIRAFLILIGLLGDSLVLDCTTFSAHNMSTILCLVPVPTAPILHPKSDLRIHDHISWQFVRKQAR